LQVTLNVENMSNSYKSGGYKQRAVGSVYTFTHFSFTVFVFLNNMSLLFCNWPPAIGKILQLAARHRQDSATGRPPSARLCNWPPAIGKILQLAARHRQDSATDRPAIGKMHTSCRYSLLLLIRTFEIPPSFNHWLQETNMFVAGECRLSE
jgi:hypothetical protein